MIYKSLKISILTGSNSGIKVYSRTFAIVRSPALTCLLNIVMFIKRFNIVFNNIYIISVTLYGFLLHSNVMAAYGTSLTSLTYGVACNTQRNRISKTIA